MPTQVVGTRSRRFILELNDEGDEIFEKYDVIILEKDPEPWVEIYRLKYVGEEEFVKEPVVTAPASEVAELLEKILSFIKTPETGEDVEAMKNIGVEASQFL